MRVYKNAFLSGKPNMTHLIIVDNIQMKSLCSWNIIEIVFSTGDGLLRNNCDEVYFYA